MKTFNNDFYDYLITGTNRLIYEVDVPKPKVETAPPKETGISTEKEAKRATAETISRGRQFTGLIEELAAKGAETGKEVESPFDKAISPEEYFASMREKYVQEMKKRTPGITSEPEIAADTSRMDLNFQKLTFAIQQLAEQGKLNGNELAELNKMKISDVSEYLDVNRRLNYKLQQIDTRIRNGALSAKDINIQSWRSAVTIKDKLAAIEEVDKVLEEDKKRHADAVAKLDAIEDRANNDPLVGLLEEIKPKG